MNDNWNEIVNLLQLYITGNSTESQYQQEIENCLRLLGWKSFNKTMQSQVTINIGNNNSIRPDIVLYKNDLPVLPIEIKRPSNICSSKQEGQLKSYMRQLRLNVGLYIGENIQFFYDNPTDLDNPISVFKIELCKNEPYGEMFCEMMSYGKFDVNELEKFCEGCYNRIIANNRLQRRWDDFLSVDNASRNIAMLVREKFIKEGFDEDDVEEELQKYMFQINRNQSGGIPVLIAEKEVDGVSGENNETEFSLDGICYYGIGRFVQTVVRRYISENPNVTLEELNERFPVRLCGYKKYKGIVIRRELVAKKDLGRFFSKDEDVITLGDTTKIVVCREWGNTGKSKPFFQSFLEHIKTFYPIIYSR